MVQTDTISAQAQSGGDIVLTPASVSETAFENEPAARLTVAGGGDWDFEILADGSGGAFRIEGDRLVVADNARLDFETAPEVSATIRATDSAGQSITRTMTIAVADEAIERRYSAGDAFRATESEAGSAGAPTVVPLAGGGFALLWILDSDPSDGMGELVARYFDSDGVPTTDEIVLFSAPGLGYFEATPLDSGGFLLARAVADPASGAFLIEAQAYDKAGNEVSPVMSVEGSGRAFAVQLDNGGYAVGWIEDGTIHVQRFDGDGAPVGADIVVGTTVERQPIGLVATHDGGFAVSWVDHTDDPDNYYQVKAQFFDSSGAPSGPPIVDRGGDFTNETPMLAALADGSYVMGWVEFSGSAGGAVFTLKALPIGADGVPSGPPVTLATYKSESLFGPSPSIVAHPDGGFVAMWPDTVHAPNDRIYYRFTARQFDSSAAPIGPEFHPTDLADYADIAVLADGTMTATWQIYDSDGNGVYARVYSPAVTEREGTSGNDTLRGDEGADRIDGLAGNDSLYGLGGDDELLGRSGNDALRGGAGDDLLRGGGGDDFLDGGSGADELRGGYGNDFYVVDNQGDRVVERAGAGWDEIRTTLATFSLAALPNIEGLSSGSDAPHDFRGNSADNFIGGGAGADLFRLQDGGEDLALGDPGNDIFYFGNAFSAGDVADGGEGRDAIVLQGNVALVLNDANFVRIESISIQSGSNPSWGDTANNRYDYSLVMADANVPAGLQMIINAQSLLVGEDLAFDGSAESNGSFLIYAGHGTDLLKGGAGNDIFFFEGTRFGASDRVDGGAGRDSVVISAGSGLNRFEFGSASFTNIESISVSNRYTTDPSQKPSYELVLANGNVTAGGNLIVNGSSLGAGQNITIDGKAVTGGSLTLFGGAAHDALSGGAGNDTLHGGPGADALSGGNGADLFRYDSTAESSAAPDLIGDFQKGLDKVDLSRIDANSGVAGNQAFTWIGSSAFSGSAGQLRVVQDGAYQRLEGDTNGDGVADLVIYFQAGTAPLAQGDFLL